MNRGSQVESRAFSEEISLSELLEGASLSSDGRKVEQIYHLLWNLIVSCRLRPNQLVSEKEISDCLRSSKTPVREALIRLEETGLVKVIPKSGTYVAPIRISTYVDACFIRLQLEIGAVRRAADRNADDRHLAELDHILEQQQAVLNEGNHEQFFALDEHLHETFFRMAGVAGAWHVLRRTQAEVYRIRHLRRIHHIRKGAKVLADHHRIVEAIRAGNPDNAVAALIAHIGALQGAIEELFTNPDLLGYIENQSIAGPHIQKRRPTAGR